MWLHDTTTGTTPLTTVTSTDFWSQLPQLIGQGLQVWNQQQVLDWARQQMQAGTPVNTATLNQMLALSSPGVNVGLAPSTQSTLEYALIGAGVLGLLFVLTKSAKR